MKGLELFCLKRNHNVSIKECKECFEKKRSGYADYNMCMDKNLKRVDKKENKC